ncbi:MAG: DEAD/DEAH box helicase family protein [DPANN group archaeon]|nr:DEAD/DEAH box helicase family protein [DPANN group archaeon]
MGIILREWQNDAYKIFKNNNYNGILKVGTGKGKTVFAIYCIKQFMKDNPDYRTCIIVPTINLMFQWKAELLKFLDL